MKLFEKGEIKLLWPFYLEAFIGTASYILPAFIVLYLTSINLTATQIGLLMGAWPLAALIFELPTGAIADLYGRKTSVMISWILGAIFLLLILVSNNFYYLLLIFFLFGVSTTLASGAYEAWPVDLLRNKKKKQLIKEYFIKKTIFYDLAFIFSGVIGAVIVATFGLGSILYASAFALLISSFFVWFGEEEYKPKRFSFRNSFKETYSQTKKSIKYGYKHHTLFYLLIISFIISLSFSISSAITWTPLLKSFDIPDSFIGYFWTLINIAAIAGVLSYKFFLKNYEARRTLITVAFLVFLCGLAIFVSNSFLIVLIFLLIWNFLGDIDYPVFRTYFHKNIPSKIRATTGSLESLIMSVGGIIAMPLTGLLVDTIGPKSTMFIAALLSLPIIFLYLKIKDNKGKK